jgi:peptidoglycan hydrolase-like protein with peptidoglycan-binding domain
MMPNQVQGMMKLNFWVLVSGFVALAGLAACSEDVVVPTLMPTAMPLPPATATLAATAPSSSTALLADTGPTATWTLTPAPPTADTATPGFTNTPVVVLVAATPTAATQAPQATPAASPTPPIFTRILSLKSPMLYGDDILLVQQRLLALHYIEMPTPDGYYGDRTRRAVMHFQLVNGQVIDGIVGPQTWAAVFSPAAIASPLVTLQPTTVASGGATPAAGRVLSLQSPPLTGPDVTQLQQQLWTLGYFPCHAQRMTVVDGIFGAQTEAALKRFQETNGLEVNGRAGPEVQARLASPSAVAATFGPMALPSPVNPPPNQAGYLAVVYGLDVYVMDADLGNLTWAVTANGASYEPVWSPEGGRLAFVSKHPDGDELFVASANGAGLTQVTCNRLAKGHPAWSPDGTRIVFAGTAQTIPETGLYLMNADGSGLALIAGTTLGWQPAWSRTNRIVFTAGTNGARHIYTINPDGSDLQTLTSGAGHDSDPAWSPDGSQIAFVSDRDGEAQIYLMNADGTNQRPLAHIRYDTDYPTHPLSHLSWSTNGRIAFSLWGVGGATKVGVINADGNGLIWYMLAGLSEPDWRP